MNTTTLDNRRKILMTTLVLLLSALACVVPVSTTVLVSSPTPKPMLSKTPTTPSETPDNTSTTATISRASVRVRKSPGGESAEVYVHSGDKVVLSDKCDENDWCPISEPVKGWIWKGCIAELADGLLCQARP
jgi:hypothetical protein